MPERCGEPNPNDETILCEKGYHPWGPHFNMSRQVSWKGKDAPVRTKQGTARVAAIIGAIEPSGDNIMTGPPKQAEQRWEISQSVWLLSAEDALRHVCRTHEEFTTGTVWPLVNNPPERRAMVKVVRFGLQQKWMVEHAAKREHGVWTTRDGVSFPLNKLVPIYRSLIYSPLSADQ
jgi:hypothetical protein